MFFKRNKKPASTSIQSVPETDWDVVLSADERLLRSFVEQFEAKYRLPLVASIMPMLRDERLANELFDDFVQDHVMSRLLQKAAHPRKGKFRHLAKKAFQNFVLKHLRDERRKPDKPGTEAALKTVAVYDRDPFDEEEYLWARSKISMAEKAVSIKVAKKRSPLHTTIWHLKQTESARLSVRDLASQYKVKPRIVYHAMDLCEQWLSIELRRLGRSEVGFDSVAVDEWLARIGRAIRQGSRRS
ncbi:MAG: hypothetical protein AAGC72_01185 [Planctomycetota bacterium]